ncbi:fatty acid hydroxylase domain-containing protein 2-like [Styela clava]
MDITGRPNFLSKYKIQYKNGRKLSWTRAKKAIGVVFSNSLINIPASYIGLLLFKLRGMNFDENIPSSSRVITDFAVFLVFEEILFYYFHRLLHRPYFFKHFHKVHHEWTSPICLSTLYCHPLEHFMSNLLPVFTGPLVCGSHLLLVYIWILIATLNGMNAHSGYHFPGIRPNEAHDYHHSKKTENHGILGVLDWLHGTDKNFKRSTEKKRDRIFFGCTPIRKIIPDPSTLSS